MKYPAFFEPTPEGGFVVTFPDFGSAVTQGHTEQEALATASAALLAMVQELIRKGEELPHPSTPRRQGRMIMLAAMPTIKAELYATFRASGLRKAEFARRLGITRTVVNRLFELTRHTHMEQLEAAFAVLNKRLEVSISDAA